MTHVAWSHEQVLDGLDRYASDLVGLASTLGLSREEADQGIQDCIRRGWIVRPRPDAWHRLDEAWAPYLMLSAEGEEVLADIRATRS